MDREIISTERTSLVPLGPANVTGKYLSWLNDPETIEYLEIYEYYTTEKLLEYLNNVEKNNILLWGIFLKNKNLHIGNIKIDPINANNLSAEYGILIGDKNARGNGYAEEASKAVIDYCAKKLQLRKLNLGVIETHAAAVKVYKKLGFKKEGIYKDAGFYKGSLDNIIRMGLSLSPDNTGNQKLILGTAQMLGSYGVVKSDSRLNFKGWSNILNNSLISGITEYDTSPEYGDALNILGSVFNNNSSVKVNSKFKNQSPEDLEQSVRSQTRALRCKMLNTLFYHRPHEYNAGDKLFKSVLNLKEKGLISKIGVSGYDNEDFKELIKHREVDVIQLPLNLIDNYLRRKEVIEIAKSNGKEIQIRSIFMQGLLLGASKKQNSYFKPLYSAIKKLGKIAKDNKMSMFQLCLSYSLSSMLIDKLLVGLENSSQFCQLLASISSKLDSNVIEQIHSISMENYLLINPNNWPR